MLERPCNSDDRDVPQQSACWLAAQVRACQGRARQSGGPVVLRLHCPRAQTGAVDPWQWLHALEQGPRGSSAAAAPPVFLWHDGRTDFSFAAWGHLDSFTRAWGESPWVGASSYWQTLRGRCVEVAWLDGELESCDLPLLVGGVAFDAAGYGTHRSRAGRSPAAIGHGLHEWQAWPAAQLRLPRLLLWQQAVEARAAGCGREGGRSGFILHTLIDAQSDVTAHVSQLWHRVQAVAAAEPHSGEPLRGMSAGVPGAAAAPTQLGEDFASWRQRVEGALGAIAAGPLQKVVLARCIDVTAPHQCCFSPWDMLANLRRRHPGSVCFGMLQNGGLSAGDATSAFVGATPEILLRVAGGRVVVHALAGTAPRGADAAQDAAHAAALLASAKERQEHAWVVQMVREVLAAQGVSVAAAGGAGEGGEPPLPRLLKLRHVQHLETVLAGPMTSEAAGVFSLLEQLHPTPAVGGYPQAAALAWLRRHESLERGWYAAPVGWLAGSGDATFAVAIRSAVMRGRRLRAYAGAGITGACAAAAEWQETELKLSLMREAVRWRPVDGGCGSEVGKLRQRVACSL